MLAFLNRVAYLAARFPIALLSLLPYHVLQVTVGRCCYFLAYTVTRYRYHVVLQNLSRSFPEKPYGEIHKLAKDFYRHFSCLVVDVIKSISISRQELAGRVRVSNPDLLAHYHTQGRHMVALLGHYGNWEGLSILPSVLPFQVNALYKPLSNRFVCDMVRRIRSRFGMQLIPAGKAVRRLIKTKDEVALNLFIADQFPGSDKGCSVEFLNQPTSLFDGAEKLAKALDAVVFYVELEAGPENGWNVQFSVITENAKQTKQGEITRSFSERLQRTIKNAPAYWLWSHRRWK